MAWALAVILDLLVPPWYERLLVSKVLLRIQHILRPPSPGERLCERPKDNPDSSLRGICMRRCIWAASKLSGCTCASPPVDSSKPSQSLCAGSHGPTGPIHSCLSRH
jgi:hypothetical protein